MEVSGLSEYAVHVKASIYRDDVEGATVLLRMIVRSESEDEGSSWKKKGSMEYLLQPSMSMDETSVLQSYGHEYTSCESGNSTATMSEKEECHVEQLQDKKK